MPATWEIRDHILIVATIGDWSSGGPATAIAEALEDSRFKQGTSLLLDVRQSSMNPAEEDVRSRTEWLSLLRAKGLSSRLAIVVGPRAYQMGVARMAQTYLENRGIELQIFADLEAATGWLSAMEAKN